MKLFVYCNNVADYQAFLRRYFPTRPEGVVFVTEGVSVPHDATGHLITYVSGTLGPYEGYLKDYKLRPIVMLDVWL